MILNQERSASMPDEMKPEPVVEFEGKISDWSEHATMLANPEANAFADELAIKQARLIGFTEEEINSYLRGPEIPIPPPPVLSEENERGRTSGNWTEPTIENVRLACEQFDGWKDNPDPALSILFEHFPYNSHVDHVLLKVIALNSTYTTLIRAFSNKTPSIYDVARHIVSRNIDEALESGNIDIVELIAKVKTDDGRKMRNYSFATKYCNWHRPHLFPIYDSRVDEYLWRLQKREIFFAFDRQDLRYNYRKFKDVVTAFRERFGLHEFSYKLIDKFLYVEGGKLLKMKMGESVPDGG
jgi:hypothetical protein